MLNALCYTLCMNTLLEILEKHRDGKSDDRVFGLIMQGGGMRAVYSAATISPLVDADLTNSFDHVVGSSAGALNVAYFLSADRNTYKTYTDSLTNRNFINPMRISSIVDIDYLIDTALKQERPIDINRLQDSRTQLHIVLTNAETGKREVMNSSKVSTDIYEQFRATAALPILYNQRIKIGDKHYIDGGVTDLLPIDVALELGCTDVVVVMTQRHDSFQFAKLQTRSLNHLIRWLGRKYPKAVREQLPTDSATLKKNLELLTNQSDDVNLYLLEPSETSKLISRSTISEKSVKSLARLGISDMQEFLSTKF